MDAAPTLTRRLLRWRDPSVHGRTGLSLTPGGHASMVATACIYKLRKHCCTSHPKGALLEIDGHEASTLDRSGATPLHRQLKRVIERGIEDGRYRPGDRLPSEHEFAREYGVSRQLARQTLSRLVAEGRVVARRGAGYYVNSRRIRRELPVLTGYTSPMREMDPSSSVKVLRQELTSEPAGAVAAMIGRTGSQAVLIERVAYLGGEPVALLADWFHPRLADFLLAADLDDRPLYDAIEQETGIRGVRAPTVVSVDFVGRRESSLLAIPDGAAVIRLDISTYAEDGFLFSASRSRFRSDRFEFTLEKRA